VAKPDLGAVKVIVENRGPKARAAYAVLVRQGGLAPLVLLVFPACQVLFLCGYLRYVAIFVRPPIYVSVNIFVDAVRRGDAAARAAGAAAPLEV
jgi:hypothetical protein